MGRRGEATLQYVAVCCSMLQGVAMNSKTSLYKAYFLQNSPVVVVLYSIKSASEWVDAKMQHLLGINKCVRVYMQACARACVRVCAYLCVSAFVCAYV